MINTVAGGQGSLLPWSAVGTGDSVSRKESWEEGEAGAGVGGGHEGRTGGTRELTERSCWQDPGGLDENGLAFDSESCPRRPCALH